MWWCQQCQQIHFWLPRNKDVRSDPTDFVFSNLVENYIWNNGRCCIVHHCNTEQYRHSFFPRTIVVWNQLDNNTVYSVPSAFKFSLPCSRPDNKTATSLRQYCALSWLCQVSKGHHHFCAPPTHHTCTRFLDVRNTYYRYRNPSLRDWTGVICEPHYSTGQVLLYLVMPEIQVPVSPGESCVCHFSLSWSKQTKKPFVCLICLRRLVGLLSLRHCK